MSELNEKLINKYKNDKLIISTYYQLEDTKGNLITLDGIVNPLKIDNRQLMSPTDNQGNVPGCAGWSACTLAESLYWKHTGKLIQLDAAQVYAKAKTIDGMRDEEGTTLEASLKAAMLLSAFDKQYSIGIFKNDRTSYTIQEVKFLIHKFDFLQAGFMIDDGWYDCDNKNFILKRGTTQCGGHAVNIVGYDCDGFYILNQWGKSFGAKGYCIMPYDLFLEQLMYVAYVY